MFSITDARPHRCCHEWLVTSGDEYVGDPLLGIEDAEASAQRAGPYLDGFAGALERLGYRPQTSVRYLRAAAHVGHVMDEQSAGLTDVDLAVLGEHLRTCRCPRNKGGRRNHHTIYGARLFRRYLVELGVCQPATVVAAPAAPKLVTDFMAWLRKHRGASDATIRLYARDAAGIMTGT